MAGETVVTVVGNLVNDPDLRFTQSGKAVANFTVASTPRVFKDGEWKDGDALFMRCNVWGQFGENVAESLTKGTRVIVQGKLRQRSYETREGEKRSVIEVEVDAVGPDLRYATAKVNRPERAGERIGQDGLRRESFGAARPDGSGLPPRADNVHAWAGDEPPF